MKRIISTIILLILIIFTFKINIVCCAIEINRFPDISLDNDFAEDRLIVVFDNDSSLEFKQYTKDDFQGLLCKNICDFTISIGESIDAAMDNVAKHILEGETLLPYAGIPIGQYNQTICIELEQCGKDNVIKAIKELQTRDDVLYAVPDYRITVSEDYPNDEYYNDTRSQYNYQKYIAKEMVGLEKVWNNVCTGLPDNYNESNVVRVGVLDTGIDEDHPDLINNINNTLCRDFTQYSSNGIQQCNHQDNSYHGTLCAGIIGAEGNNGIGLAGVCWNIELVSLKVLDSDKLGYASNVGAAISYANNNLDVLNMSLSFTSIDDYFEERYANNSFEEMISNFNGIVVCSAGNNSENIDDNIDVFYPQQYSSPDINNMIVVGASDGDNIYAESNFGSESVDLFAPGVNICSTYPVDYCSQGMHPDNDETYCAYDDYHSSSGTSFAAPYVAGTVALMLCIDQNLSETTIINALIDSVDQKNAYSNKCVSGGRLNVFNALMEIVDHSLHDTYYTKTDTTHTFHCNDCDYHASTESHEFYISSVNSSGTVVGCLGCDYTLNCDDQPSYTSNGSTGHRVECSCACYSFIEKHDDFSCIGLPNDLYSHIVYCVDCGYSFYESHHWIRTGLSQLYICSDCGCTSDEDFVPGIMSLPDPELAAYLASLSEDELAEFIASLPEDQAARVTALLPSDDELLTE